MGLLSCFGCQSERDDVVETRVEQKMTVDHDKALAEAIRGEQPSVVVGENSPGYTEDGEIVSTQTFSSKSRTIETITYQTKRDGVVETRVKQKLTIQSDEDPLIDHDKALAEAIQSQGGVVGTRVNQKITIQSKGSDHDTALAEAIREAQF